MQVYFEKDENPLNKMSADLVNVVKTIIITNSYRKKLENIPSTIECILLENEYNEELPKLKHINLKCLKLGYRYDKKLPLLPRSIKYIKISCDYCHVLPKLKRTKLRYLYIKNTSHYNKEFPILPKSIRKLKLNDFFNCAENKFPDLMHTKIKSLTVGFLFEYCGNIAELFPPSLKTLKLGVFDKYNKSLFSPFKKYTLNGALYLKTILINKQSIKINKYNNQIYDVKDIGYNAYLIKKNLQPYMFYMCYNNIKISYDIYDYIYKNFNFTYNNI